MRSPRPLEGQGRRAAVIVAHPDDETLWAGGTLLICHGWQWSIFALCRASDPDRAPKFRRVMELYGAGGGMADLDDAPEQTPLSQDEVRQAILTTLPGKEFDVIFTHGPRGEYARHLRHEETSAAVLGLWESGELVAKEVLMFAYEDGGGLYVPRAVQSAHVRTPLPPRIWQRKHEILTGVYGFSPESFEARAAPVVEAFWCFASPEKARRWVGKEGDWQ